MKNVNHIGVIVYKQYEENVMLKGLDINKVNNILSTDNDALRFEIREINTNKVTYIFNVSRETLRESEQKGIIYNGYAKKPYTIHEKVRWSNLAGTFKTKKLAEQKRIEYNKEKIINFTQVHKIVTRD